MRYIDYLIKCIIRRLVRLIFKPKVLVSILFILLILTLTLYNNSYAAEWAPSSDVVSSYNDVANDFVVRLTKAPSSSYKNTIFNRINGGQYSYYVYYGPEINGHSMIGLEPSYNSSTMFIAFYLKNVSYLGSPWDSYNGLVTNMRGLEPFDIYEINSDGSITHHTLVSGQAVYLPTVIFNYASLSVSEYIQNQQNFDNINNSITEGTDKINNSINDTNNFIKDDTISDDSMSIDTTGMTVEGQGDIDNFFTGFLDTVYNAFLGIDDNVETIEIPLPYGIHSLVLSSDLLSKHIIKTPLYALIQVFWTFVIGRYIVMFVKRIFDWLSTGKVAEQGVFSFIEWLDVNNEIIKSYMM